MDFKIAVILLFLMAQTPQVVDFHVLKEKFVPGEQVCFEFINQRRQPVQLPNPNPWMVVDEKGEIIFSPVTIQVIETLAPASTKRWCWDQRRNNGQLVDSGRYIIKLNVYIENERKSFSREIEIVK
jgi:hypothetical protein